MTLEHSLLAGNTPLNDAKMDELVRIRQAAAIEIVWWESQLIEDPEVAKARGELLVVPDEGRGYRLIWKLRSGRESNLVRPRAYDLLLEITQRWQEALRARQIPGEDVFLSVPSLYRTKEQQEAQILKGANATLVSAHQAGAAIDFDPNGYYLGEQRVSVSSFSADYRAEYTDELAKVLLALEQEGKCHVIEEKGFKESGGGGVQEYLSCYHVCVSLGYERTAG